MIKKIGVLSIQGNYKEHIQMLYNIKYPVYNIIDKHGLKKIDALIIPGGESTTLTQLLHSKDMFFILRERILDKSLYVFGTCAGMIIVCNILNIPIMRNIFGRQINSFESIVSIKNIGKVNAVFIRSPAIFNDKIDKIDVISVYDNMITGFYKNNVLCVSFHPELCGDSKLHEFFIKIIN